MHRLTRTTTVRGDLATVFSFFMNPYNLEQITPPSLRFHVTSTSDVTIGEGTRISYRLRLHGVPLTWTSRIDSFSAPTHFVDNQLAGPYAQWRHRHTFRQVADGVEMTDDVEYRLPFGLLGRFVHWLVVRRELEAIFDRRNEVIAGLFGVPDRP
jgi:ligand-binding SRPBCC domain-containing protein